MADERLLSRPNRASRRGKGLLYRRPTNPVSILKSIPVDYVTVTEIPLTDKLGQQSTRQMVIYRVQTPIHQRRLISQFSRSGCTCWSQ